jgi:hypothetical protein
MVDVCGLRRDNSTELLQVSFIRLIMGETRAPKKVRAGGGVVAAWNPHK